MEKFIVIVGIVAILAAIVSLVAMLFRKRRKLGFQMFIVSTIVFVASAYFLREANEKSAREAGFENYAEQILAKEAGYTSASEWAENRDQYLAEQTLKRETAAEHARLEEEARIAAETERKRQIEKDRLEQLNGFPDEATQQLARAKGISRYEAYKRLSDPNVIREYCTYAAQSSDLSKQRMDAQEATNNQDRKTEIWNEFEKRQEALLTDFNLATGLQGNEVFTLFTTGFWDFHCRAAKRRWSIITEMSAKAATRSDASEAARALEAFYLWNLNNETSRFFDKDIFSAVSCRNKRHNDMRFVGCQLISFTRKSKWQVFVVGRTGDGQLAVSPINGNTGGKLDATQARFHDENYEKRIFVQAYDEPRAYLAEYAGTRIDIPTVIGLFE